MLSLSQSFRMGSGSLEHNLRITKGRGIRQNGVMERRHLNEDIIVIGDKYENDYVHRLIHNTVDAKVGAKLAELNEKHLQQNHPGRVRTVDEWIESQAYTRNGKRKSIVREYIVQLGDKYSGIPYIPATNEQGEMLDVAGNVIAVGDTRKIVAYKDNVITENPVAKRIKSVYREFVKQFQKRNPQAVVLSASVHSDERGGCHMHMSVIWFSHTKNGLGYGLSETSAIRQQYAARGIKCQDARTKNAQSKWRNDMRLLLESIAMDYGIERKDMHNKNDHLPTPQYQELSDRRSELNERERLLQDKELELSSDIAKQEWYILKTRYPEMYEKIHNEFIAYRKNVRNAVDERANVCYNNI